MEPSDEILIANAREMYEALKAAWFVMSCENLYETEGYEKTESVLCKVDPEKYDFKS